jgi:hypothetical protein
VSIDKIKYTYANIIFKGTVQRKTRATGLRKMTQNFKEKLAEFLLADYYENVD